MKKFAKALAAIMLMTVVLFAAGCGKDDNSNNNGGGTNDEVTVITTTPQDITSTSAVCGGAVSVSDGITLSEVGVCWSTSSTPTVAGSHVSAGNVEEQFTCTVSGLEPDTKYYVCAYALCGEKFYYGNAKDFTTLNNGGSYNGHDYVDLGLPSGTLWATCNVGAGEPEGYGNYYAWGETETKLEYDWFSYNYAYVEGYNVIITKYNNSDGQAVLLPVDDAATVHWGDGWQMPTADQWRELEINTNNSWTIQNGVHGRLFVGSNGNSIFLPAAGARWDHDYNEVDDIGIYWSSSLDVENIMRAWFLYCDEGSCHVGVGGRGGEGRAIGCPIRPVRSAK